MKAKLLVASLAMAAFSAMATPIVVTSQLTGDPHLLHPDGINLKVKVETDTTSNQATWTVDLDSAAAHPNMKLDQFFFNMQLGNLFSFGGFNPNGWAVAFPGTNPPDGGTLDFAFRALDPFDFVNAPDVTNATSLSFVMTKLNGLFEADDFLSAPVTWDLVLGHAQLGAHVYDLAHAWLHPDHGFATGMYTDASPTPQSNVPEPASLALLGVALLGAGAATRKKPNATPKLMMA